MLWIEEDKTMVVGVMKDLVGVGVHGAVDREGQDNGAVDDEGSGGCRST